MNSSDTSDWKLVYSTGTEYLAELLKQVLFDNNIQGIIMNRQDSSYHIGDIEVLVNPSDFDKAKSISIEFENNTSIE